MLTVTKGDTVHVNALQRFHLLWNGAALGLVLTVRQFT